MTTTTNGQDERDQGERDEFERLLETFGPDLRRWPTGEAKRHEGDGQRRDAASQKLLREEQALDALLNRATGVADDRAQALLDRIVLAAERQPQRSGDARHQHNVTPLAAKRRTMFQEHGLAFAALAAALVLGVLAGTSTALQPVAEAVAIVAAGEGDAQQIAVAGDNDSGIDEDFL